MSFVLTFQTEAFIIIRSLSLGTGFPVILAGKYIYPVIDRNRPIRNTSRLLRLSSQCCLPIENITNGVLR